MNLHAYFNQHRSETIAAIAERAGSNLSYLQHCKYGNRRMSADLAIRLEWASGGELTARELRPDLPWPGITPTHDPVTPEAA